jgi:hypothetical protein
MAATLAIEARARVAADRWLFSRGVDLAVFLGPAIASLLLLWLGARFGLLDDGTPDWAWVPAVLFVDVAHVYSTSFRVYLDGDELRRRARLYTLVPLIGFGVAFLLYAAGEAVFWRALAYLAVFHFVRQQYGWVALYRGRCGEHDRIGHWLDAAAIYAATLYPLAYWHAHLPRRFWWFVEGDFGPGLPAAAVSALEPVYWCLLAAYAARSLWAWLVLRRPNPGKDVVVATTAACWYAGIVAYDSDYAFTVTNVLIHGVPYFALVYANGRKRGSAAPDSVLAKFFEAGLLPVLATLWVVAYAEELLWDRAVWGDREWLFGEPWEIGASKYLLVPLLALPQIVHYVLDGFIWRRRTRLGG